MDRKPDYTEVGQTKIFENAKNSIDRNEDSITKELNIERHLFTMCQQKIILKYILRAYNKEE